MKIKILDTRNLMEASLKGANSDTAILFKRYVDPQMTYMAKKASMMFIVLRGTPIYKFEQEIKLKFGKSTVIFKGETQRKPLKFNLWVDIREWSHRPRQNVIVNRHSIFFGNRLLATPQN